MDIRNAKTKSSQVRREGDVLKIERQVEETYEIPQLEQQLRNLTSHREALQKEIDKLDVEIVRIRAILKEAY